jgi:GDP-4-dehydro-6-deoxy-D-mannose reductase
MSPPPVLVTGGAGFVGGHLLERLAASGRVVHAWHRPGSPPGPPGLARWTAVELLDAAGATAALAEAAPAEVYHLAGAANVALSWSQPRQTLEDNVLATHRLFEALRTAALRPRVLVTGSAAVYRPSDAALHEGSPLGPASPYGTSKLAQELLALRAGQDDGVEVVVTRSFNHIGPRQDPGFIAASIARQVARIEAGLDEPVIAVGNLEAKRDLMDVRDTVRAYEALMAGGRAGAVYNVCAGHAIAMRTLLDGLVGRARVPVRIFQDPARFRPNDTPLSLGDCTRLRTDTGWALRYSLDETLDALLASARDALTDPGAR